MMKGELELLLILVFFTGFYFGRGSV